MCCTSRQTVSRAISSPAPATTTTPSGGCTNHGSLTAAGRELKDHIESSTDALGLSALDALRDDEVEALFQALTPITRAVVAGGDLPDVTPMNLHRDELHDGSAHLV